MVLSENTKTVGVFFCDAQLLLALLDPWAKGIYRKPQLAMKLSKESISALPIYELAALNLVVRSYHRPMALECTSILPKEMLLKV
jgi:hypothetical protein